MMLGNLFGASKDATSFVNDQMRRVYTAHMFIKEASQNYTRQWADMSPAQRLWMCDWLNKYNSALENLQEMGFRGAGLALLPLTADTALYLGQIIDGFNSEIESLRDEITPIKERVRAASKAVEDKLKAQKDDESDL